jgi:hypothetical protein
MALCAVLRHLLFRPRGSEEIFQPNDETIFSCLRNFAATAVC